MSYEQPKQQLEFEADLMTAEQYAKLGEYPRPYVFEITNGDSAVHYFGSSHSCNPDHPQFLEIRKQFDSFNPDLVMIEGWSGIEEMAEEDRKLLADNPPEVIIEKVAEPGFTAKLAYDKQIPIVSPEAKLSEEIDYLQQQGFRPEDITAYYIAREITGYQRKREPELFQETMQRWLNQVVRTAGWLDLELEEVLKKIEEISGASTDITDKDLYHSLVDPIPWSDKPDFHITNSIAQRLNLFRDNQMMYRLREYKEKYKRIFIVFGASHAVMQEPAIRKMMED